MGLPARRLRVGEDADPQDRVAEFCRATRQPASYTRMAEIIDHLRGSFDAKNPSEESTARLDMWSELPFLAIDEFDRVRSTEYATERRFVLMDRRYEQACRQRSITLMASNCTPDDLEGYLADRIYDGRFKVVHLQDSQPGP
jgi:DNA replication protein DnaC